MEDDKKALLQRYSELTTTDLIELQRSNRLPTAEAAMVDEMLSFRGVSKAARENLKNSPAAIPVASSGEGALRLDTFYQNAAYKSTAQRPVLIVLIALFALWGFFINLYSVFQASSAVAFIYFLIFAILSICLAVGLLMLKPWARKFMIFYSGFKIFLGWLFYLLLFMALDEYWRSSLAELTQSANQIGTSESTAGSIRNTLFLFAFVHTAVYGALIAYFYRPNIRRLFQ